MHKHALLKYFQNMLVKHFKLKNKIPVKFQHFQFNTKYIQHILVTQTFRFCIVTLNKK